MRFGIFPLYKHTASLADHTRYVGGHAKTGSHSSCFRYTKEKAGISVNTTHGWQAERLPFVTDTGKISCCTSCLHDMKSTTVSFFNFPVAWKCNAPSKLFLHMILDAVGKNKIQDLLDPFNMIDQCRLSLAKHGMAKGTSIGTFCNPLKAVQTQL
jgi:hypothetical protein